MDEWDLNETIDSMEYLLNACKKAVYAPGKKGLTSEQERYLEEAYRALSFAAPNDDE